MAKMDEAEIRRRLVDLPGWEISDGAIRKQFKVNQFMDGIDFVNRVAEIAEAQDHHPDIAINWTRITMSCSTHSEHGVTAKDFRLAGDIEIAFADTSH